MEHFALHPSTRHVLTTSTSPALSGALHDYEALFYPPLLPSATFAGLSVDAKTKVPTEMLCEIRSLATAAKNANNVGIECTFYTAVYANIASSPSIAQTARLQNSDCRSNIAGTLGLLSKTKTLIPFETWSHPAIQILREVQLLPPPSLPFQVQLPPPLS